MSLKQMGKVVANSKSNHLPGQETEDLDRYPVSHVAIIMDGNRRWADRQGLPRLAGHRAGVRALKRLVQHVAARRLGYLTVYAFSSENWQRSTEEVDYLLNLFATVIREELDELSRGGVRLRFIGQLSEISSGLNREFHRAMKRTENNTGLNLQVAINYGSRNEIAEAVKQIAQLVKDGKLSIEEIDAGLIGRFLFTRDIPDPDLLIRTGGEMRLSNYLLWQSAYTEFHMTPVLWPEFSPDDFEKAIADFTSRDRRFGGD